eukprot:c15253_g1_i1.p1 GENE.c15253_g1_i1~~c15253_g1_i1.p1  ORF type:complete len:278 (+),score=131.03 c15253_g1_i1:35-835(+)
MSLKTEDLFNVSGKVVVVTGGARGIGLMITRAFVDNGAKVYISSRKAEECDKVAAELTAKGPGSCVALAEDLATEKGCLSFVQRFSKVEKRLDVLVNNSGTSWGAPLNEFPEAGWDKVYSLNLKAPFYLTRSFLPLLEQSVKERNEPSRVIMIGSIAGIAPQLAPTYSYDALKAALHHLTRKFAAEFASKKITVNAIAPGLFPSSMSKQLETYASKESIVSAIPLKRAGRDTDMAATVLYLSGSGGSFVTGIILTVDGGATSRSAM